MERDNDYTSTIVVLVLLVLVILGVIGLQKYRDIKYLLDTKEEVVDPSNKAANNNYILIEMGDIDYIVNNINDTYKYAYSSNNINYLGKIDDVKYFNDNTGIFSVDNNKEFNRVDINSTIINKGYFDNDVVYFLDNGRLIGLDLIEQKRRSYSEVEMTTMYYYNKMVYYTSDNNLYSLDLEKDKLTKITSDVIDVMYKENTILILHSDNTFKSFDIVNNKINDLGTLNYNELITNSDILESVVYYLDGHSIIKNSNGKIETYYSDDNMVGFEIVNKSVIKIYYLDGSIHYVENKKLVEGNPLASYEIIMEDGNNISFNSSNIKE